MSGTSVKIDLLLEFEPMHVRVTVWTPVDGLWIERDHKNRSFAFLDALPNSEPPKKGKRR